MRLEAGMVKVERLYFNKNQEHLKIVQLSDIHIDMLKVPVKKIIAVLNLEAPDLVIVTGDYIRKPSQAGRFLEFLSEIKDNRNFYLCLGNHDFDAFQNDKEGLADFINRIEKLGVKVLNNRSLCIAKNQKIYNIIGISDLLKGNVDINEALKGCDCNASFNIAISHCPDVIFDIPQGTVDFLFTGHYHGGQIWNPFGLELKYLEDGRLYKTGIKQGSHKVNGINLYINRGLGNEKLPFRFLARPEITVFYLP